MDIDYQSMIQFMDLAVDRVKDYTPKLVGAIFTLILGRRILGRISKVVRQAFIKTHLDITVSTFLANLISVGLKVLLLISVAGMFGIQTTSFIALIGAAGLAIGMSLQGSLSNFAGGVLILLFKPYTVGDFIETKSIKGTVTEIGILSTILTTPEKNTAIIPNGSIINDNIINFTSEDASRVDVAVGISYSADIDTAKKVLLAMVEQHDGVLKNPAPGVFVSALGDSSVNLIVRGFCHAGKYRETYFALTEKTKKTLDAAGIEIPFPQRVLHTAPEKKPTVKKYPSKKQGGK